MNKLLNLLGLCRRAGRLTLGNDPVTDSVISKKAFMVLIASDASQHTAKDMLILCHKCGIKAAMLSVSKDDLSAAVGKYCAVVAICDAGFAKKAATLVDISE